MEGTAYMEEPRAATNQPDSDEEEETRDQKDSEFKIEYEIDQLAGALADGGKLVLCDQGTAQALIRIVFGDDLTSIGKIKVTNNKDGKTEDALEIFSGKGIVFFFLKKVGSNHCGQIVDMINSTVKKNYTVVGLSTTYKTNFMNPEGLFVIDSEKPLPMKFIKTSDKNAELEGFLSANSEQIQPNTAFNWQGGIQAAFLME